MAEIYLEFEKPLVELRKKLQELQELSENNKVDLSLEIESLTGRINETMKEIYSSLTPWQRVQLARHPERPYTLDYIEHIFTNFIELAGDRRFRDDKAIIGGFAKFQGKPIMVIGTQKGRDMKSNLYRNFGWPSPEGYRKAMRLMQLADKAGVPIVTFIDTPGAFPGIASEERHIAEAIAVNLRDMFALRVPVISIVIGEGGSGGAIGIGVGNRILIMENAYYSVITPEGCAAILWKDRKFAPQAADALQLTAEKLLELGIADGIIPEPFGGAQRDHAEAAKLLGEALSKQLAELRKLSGNKLREQRYDKFRAMGKFTEVLPVQNSEETTEKEVSE
ncbi:MAG: acetyl-CoA carboxylase carboxyltransferase subunit alpha [Victivallales bacterium]|jgi:acetyl-CoA carboxylase carboxyl transferase subunit alpha|nr:acetyl-CoA carboxylase carboxyltransferase subunit alpha [Victivallales bacterium]